MITRKLFFKTRSYEYSKYVYTPRAYPRRFVFVQKTKSERGCREDDDDQLNNFILTSCCITNQRPTRDAWST